MITMWSNQKGGVGKTSGSVNQTHFYARQGKRVLLIDQDPQANSTSSLSQYEIGRTVSLWEEEFCPPALDGTGAIALFSAARKGAETTNPLSFISGIDDLQRMTPFVKNVHQVAPFFDVVIIDSAPALDIRTLASLAVSDFVVSPIELEQYSIDGIGDMVEAITWSQENTNERLKFLGMVANRVNPKSLAQRNLLTKLLADYGDYVLPCTISIRTAIGEAAFSSESIFDMKKKSARAAALELEELFTLLDRKMEELA